MNKLTECPCCGYPHDDIEAKAMDRILNKIKADTIYDAVIDLEDNLNFEACAILIEYANRLQKGTK